MFYEFVCSQSVNCSANPVAERIRAVRCVRTIQDEWNHLQSQVHYLDFIFIKRIKSSVSISF